MKLKSKSLAAVLDQSVALSKKVLDFGIEYLITLGAIAILMVGVLKAPEIHNRWMHAKVGSKVYKIQAHKNGGGGTGFAIKGPSGTSYILTNDHVCGISQDGSVLVTGNDGAMMRNIIAHDENSDLCLIEGMPGVEGLNLAGSEPSLGETLYVVGHPLLMPTHVSSGEMTGKEDIMVPLGVMGFQNPQTGEYEAVPPEQGGIPPEKCMLAKHRQIVVNMNVIFFTIPVTMCAEYIHDSYVTGVTIFPGNSGSPVVNAWGNVEAVAFAGDSQTNWGRMVSHSDIKNFLKYY